MEMGYQIDLSDFSIVKNPTEIKAITDIMKEFPRDSKTFIMTARRGQSLGPIMDYLEEIGIDTSQVRPMATQGESKGDVIATMIGNKILPNGKSNINKIEYFEDSTKNIQDVLEKVCRNPDIKDIKPDDFVLIIKQVIRKGDSYTLQNIEC